MRQTATSQNMMIVGLLATCVGCGRMGSFTSSGIPKAVSDIALLEAAGKSQGLSSGGGGERVSNKPYSTDIESNFDVAISSGTPGQLLAAYRKEVRAKIESLGGSIHGDSVSGCENDISAFSYDYDWSGNSGIVRVRSFVNADGRIRVFILCYEHVR